MSKLSKNYLSLTFLIMLTCWGICLLCSLNGISINDNKLLFVPYALGGWSPTIASYFSLKRSGKVAGFRDWLKNVFDFKHSVLSYLMVFFMAILFILPLCLICGYERKAPVFSIIVMIPAMLFAGGLEETGWRYILQPEIEKKLPFTVSTVIVSVIWWLWHLPLFFIQGVGQYGQNFFGFGISVLGLTFALASIRKNTGSVWLCVLFHSLVNSLSGIYEVKGDIFGGISAGSITTAVILILCSCVLVKINDEKRIFN